MIKIRSSDWSIAQEVAAVVTFQRHCPRKSSLFLPCDRCSTGKCYRIWSDNFLMIKITTVRVCARYCNATKGRSKLVIFMEFWMFTQISSDRAEDRKVCGRNSTPVHHTKQTFEHVAFSTLADETAQLTWDSVCRSSCMWVVCVQVWSGVSSARIFLISFIRRIFSRSLGSPHLTWPSKVNHANSAQAVAGRRRVYGSLRSCR